MGVGTPNPARKWYPPRTMEKLELKSDGGCWGHRGMKTRQREVHKSLTRHKNQHGSRRKMDRQLSALWDGHA